MNALMDNPTPHDPDVTDKGRFKPGDVVEITNHFPVNTDTGSLHRIKRGMTATVREVNSEDGMPYPVTIDINADGEVYHGFPVLAKEIKRVRRRILSR